MEVKIKEIIRLLIKFFLLEFYLILTNNKYSSYRVGV